MVHSPSCMYVAQWGHSMFITIGLSPYCEKILIPRWCHGYIILRSIINGISRFITRINSPEFFWNIGRDMTLHFWIILKRSFDVSWIRASRVTVGWSHVVASSTEMDYHFNIDWRSLSSAGLRWGWWNFWMTVHIWAVVTSLSTSFWISWMIGPIVDSSFLTACNFILSCHCCEFMI